nr:sodium/glucose cotransporter 4-like [Lytechinus pictus]
MGSMTSSNIEGWDIAVICIHFVVVFSLGIWASWGGGKDSTSGYFLAGRNMPWWLVGISLYVTNIGSSSFIGMAGTAAVSGIAVIAYEYYALVCLLLLGFVFSPVYFASEISTVPQYLKKRFGGDRLQTFISVINLIVVVIMMLAGEMYGGTIVIQTALGWNVYTSVISLLLLTAIYTVAGGLKAVIYTDALQAVIMIIGAFVLIAISIAEIGGIGNLRLLYMTAIPNTTQIYGNTTCGIPQEDTWHIFRDAKSGDIPWPGLVFGIFILGLYFWCSNQVIVQRTLSAKNVTHSKAGCILTGYFKILPMYLMIWPGMISRSLWPDEVACVEPGVCEKVCSNPAGCGDIAYPKLVVNLMPTGAKGLMLAAMLAALVSTLTSIFNAASSMFVLDIWVKVRPTSTELEMVIVGKLCTIIFMIVGVLWLPVIQSYGSGGIVYYVQSILSYLSPSVFAVFTAAIAWSRVNEKGAFWGLVIGFATGFTRAIMEFVYGIPTCLDEDTRPDVLKNFHFLHFAAFLYAFTLILIVCISLMTDPIPPSKLVRLTFWTRHSTLPREPMSKEEEEREKEYDAVRKGKKMESDLKYKNRTGLKWKAWSILCGISGSPMDEDAEIEAEKQAKAVAEKQALAADDPKWEKFVAFNGVLLAGLCVFVFGYYA